MSVQPRHVGRRRAPGRVRRLPDLPSVANLRAGAKGLAGMGVVAGFGAAVALPAPPAATAAASTALALPAQGGEDALLGRAADTPAASRSTERGPVKAPKAAAPTRSSSFGVVGVKAVAKPKPKVVIPSASSPVVTTTSGYATTGVVKPGFGVNALRVYNAVRSTFGITNIGGYRSGPGAMDHGTGHACDVMITSADQGNAVAAFAIANAKALNIKYIIWQQRIWTEYNPTWRLMEDRGSITANHFDHVHISVY